MIETRESFILGDDNATTVLTLTGFNLSVRPTILRLLTDLQIHRTY